MRRSFTGWFTDLEKGKTYFEGSGFWGKLTGVAKNFWCRYWTGWWSGILFDVGAHATLNQFGDDYRGVPMAQNFGMFFGALPTNFVFGLISLSESPAAQVLYNTYEAADEFLTNLPFVPLAPSADDPNTEEVEGTEFSSFVRRRLERIKKDSEYDPTINGILRDVRDGSLKAACYGQLMINKSFIAVNNAAAGTRESVKSAQLVALRAYEKSLIDTIENTESWTLTKIPETILLRYTQSGHKAGSTKWLENEVSKMKRKNNEEKQISLEYVQAAIKELEKFDPNEKGSDGKYKFKDLMPVNEKCGEVAYRGEFGDKGKYGLGGMEAASEEEKEKQRKAGLPKPREKKKVSEPESGTGL